MAKIIKDEKEVEVKDGDSIKEAFEQLGVLFGCLEGICGSCIIEVLEGAENLSEITQAETDMNLQPNQRLACQCKIKSGIVKIK